MVEERGDFSEILAISRRITTPLARRLFARFCHEIRLLCDDMQMEVSEFEVSFRNDSGFSVSVSPLRELFIVSIGDTHFSDIRVCSNESFCIALDSVLCRHLSTSVALDRSAVSDGSCSSNLIKNR